MGVLKSMGGGFKVVDERRNRCCVFALWTKTKSIGLTGLVPVPKKLEHSVQEDACKGSTLTLGASRYDTISRQNYAWAVVIAFESTWTHNIMKLESKN